MSDNCLCNSNNEEITLPRDKLSLDPIHDIMECTLSKGRGIDKRWA